MKKFELKFYREWYDALAELSREERANAALALLEYVYDGKIPEDKFIRIVTTLMRNKIDREIEAFEKGAARKNKHLQDERELSKETTVTEPETPVQNVKTNDTAEPNIPEEITVAPNIPEESFNDERDECNDKRNETDEKCPQISEEEARQLRISSEKADAINGVLSQHFQTDNKQLLRFCRKNSVDIHDLVDKAKYIMAEWAIENDWIPDKYPDRSTESVLYKIDKLALNRISSV